MVFILFVFVTITTGFYKFYFTGPPLTMAVAVQFRLVIFHLIKCNCVNSYPSNRPSSHTNFFMCSTCNLLPRSHSGQAPKSEKQLEWKWISHLQLLVAVANCSSVTITIIANILNMLVKAIKRERRSWIESKQLPFRSRNSTTAQIRQYDKPFFRFSWN